MCTLERALASADLVAVLGRDVPVRIRNVSTSGCLLEASLRLDASTTGTIRVTANGRVYEDTIRVAWCRACEGAGPLYHIGASFLRTSPPAENSLRRMVAALGRKERAG